MKIKLSKSKWEKIGKQAGWSPVDKKKTINEISDLLDRAEKLLSIIDEVNLAIELQKFNMRILSLRS